MLRNSTMELYLASVDNSTDFNSTAMDALWNSSVGLSSDLVKMAQILSRSVTVVFGLVGLLFNCFVFEAIRKVSPKSLQSKPLIQNSIIADISLDIGTLLVIMSFTFEGFKAHRALHYGARLLSNHINAGMVYAQVFATILLACDRMYAVIKPMTYHTVGYNTLAKTILITSAWLSAISLTIAGIIFPYIWDTYVGEPFHSMLSYGFISFTYTTRAILAIWANISIFVLYVIIFIVFNLQRRMNRAVQTSTSEKSGTLSLTLTYFLIHTTTLCLYLPGPIFNLLIDQFPTTLLSRRGWAVVNQIMVMFYICNTISNPVILGLRIRLVRQNLTPILKSIKQRVNGIKRGESSKPETKQTTLRN